MRLKEVVNHLKTISKSFKESGSEIVIFCPYCDDDKRVNAKQGHLYIAKNFPVFNCFRCSSSGTLIRFLVETGFKDEETLNYLSQFIKYKFLPDQYYNKKKVPKLDNLYRDIILKNIDFQQQKPDFFEIYKNYLKERLGDVDFCEFLITPGFYYNKLTCDFTNSEHELVTQRLVQKLVLHDKEVRYHLNTNNSLYFFQEKNFEKYNNIVMAEGVFDITSLYLYNSDFKNFFFVSVNGKKYISALEKLLIEDLLLGHFTIHLVFDNDVYNYNMYIQRCKFLAQKFNDKVIVKGWLPLIQKDVGDFPVIKEIPDGGNLDRSSRKDRFRGDSFYQ
jgi:hypothetical protein